MTVLLNNESFMELRKNLISSKVTGIHLIQYVSPDGQIENSDVELEIIYNNKSYFRLSSASDGERVLIHKTPWVDPFVEPISEDNQLYIQESGKWSFFDVSDCPPFASIVGKDINGIEAIINKFDILSGIAFSCTDKNLYYFVDCDEGKIFLGKDNPEMANLGFRIQKQIGGVGMGVGMGSNLDL